MAADDEPVGDEEALAVLLPREPEVPELLDEDPRWLQWLFPGYAAAMVVLVASLALAPDDGWVAQHRVAIVFATFVLSLGASTAWHRGHPFRSIDDRVRDVVAHRELRGWRGGVVVAAALTAWGGFLLASAAGLASHTGGHTPVDEERSFPTPDWLLPFALAVLAVGVVGFVLAILFLAPKVDESDLVFRDPPWIAKVVFVGLVYAAPIFVGLAATESAQRWVPLALNLICTPLCLVVIWTNDAGGRRELTDDELLDRWGSEPDPRGERFRGRAERADGA